ncbi:MAG: zinc-binding dehydrogenase, partial [Myxococcales bacterium]|nr:zinc-binding dehydrogenase [Myxococcales bacterium]
FLDTSDQRLGCQARVVADGTVRPLVHATFPLDDVRRAHEALEAGGHLGKILLTA